MKEGFDFEYFEKMKLNQLNQEYFIRICYLKVNLTDYLPLLMNYLYFSDIFMIIVLINLSN